MNPWGLIFISLGLLMIIIGFKGSQHSVMDAFKGAGASSKKADPKNPKNIPPLMSKPKLA